MLGMVFIVVCLFNSIRATAVICLAVPLAIIGAVAGLLITNNPFGFMALLGLLSLGGEQIKNSIVLLEEIFIQIHHGEGALCSDPAGGRKPVAAGASGRRDDGAWNDSAPDWTRFSQIWQRSSCLDWPLPPF